MSFNQVSITHKYMCVCVCVCVRAQAVIIARTELSLLPDFLNPDVKQCELPSSNKPVAW